MYLTLAALVLGAWRFSRLGLFQPGDRVGYWIGVTGGVMMLLLLLYPMRKYLRFMRSWGKVKWWFVVHMILGIGGPWLILIHSAFHLRSVNATVAMVSMLVVAGSGVVGRFLYLRIHRGLHGERNNLSELQQRAGLVEGEMTSSFRFAPEVAARLLAFEAHALDGGTTWAATLKRFVSLPVRQLIVQRQCVRELDAKLLALAREGRWTPEQHKRRVRQAHALTRQYLQGVVRVAQFTTYVRLFALWHVAHVPFVYLLVITACFHVFAVHAY